MAVVRVLIMLGWCNGVGIGGVAASQLGFMPSPAWHGTARNGMRHASAPKPETGHICARTCDRFRRIPPRAAAARCLPLPCRRSPCISPTRRRRCMHARSHACAHTNADKWAQRIPTAALCERNGDGERGLRASIALPPATRAEVEGSPHYCSFRKVPSHRAFSCSGTNRCAWRGGVAAGRGSGVLYVAAARCMLPVVRCALGGFLSRCATVHAHVACCMVFTCCTLTCATC
jgi:hypothetical protein